MTVLALKNKQVKCVFSGAKKSVEIRYVVHVIDFGHNLHYIRLMSLSWFQDKLIWMYLEMSRVSD